MKTILGKMFLRVEFRAPGILKSRRLKLAFLPLSCCADVGSEFRDRNLISVVLTQAR